MAKTPSRKTKPKLARGRPSKLDAQMLARVCRLMVEKRSLARACNEKGMPDFSTVYDWENRGQEHLKDGILTTIYAQFSQAFARAKTLQAHAIMSELMDIADDGSNDWQIGKYGPMLNHEHVSRSKLRVETRLKLVERLAPAIYAPTQKMANADGSNLPAPPSPLSITVNGTVDTGSN